MSAIFQNEKTLDEPIFNLEPPPVDENAVHLCIYSELQRDAENTKQEDDWNLRMTCTQEWFIRCSWTNKFLFLELLCKSTSGFIVLENVLKTIDSIFSKDVLESLSHNSTNFDYDRIPTDDNRALNKVELNDSMKDAFFWFVNLDCNCQIRVILRLLRLGGGGLIFMVYKVAEKIFKERQEAIDQLAALKTVEPSNAQLTEYSEPQQTRDERSLSSESVKDHVLNKQKQMERRESELLNYKKLRGLLENDSKTARNGETVDFLQILPINVSRRIMSYIDDKTLLTYKRVGKYWSKMIDDSINEKSGRKAINAKINKIIGIKADKEEKKKQEEVEGEIDEEEEVEVIKELGAKDLINAKNENEKNLTTLTEYYKDIFTKECRTLNLNTLYNPERCGVCNIDLEIFACSTPSNLVHFYSLRTGARFNFLVFGLGSTITCLTFHENKINIFIGCKDGSLICRDFRTNETTAKFTGHTMAITSMFTTSLNFLSASEDNTIKYFQLWSGVCLLCIDLSSDLNISSVLLRSDKSYLTAIGSEDGVLLMVNVETKKFLSKTKLHCNAIRHLAHDGDILITGSAGGKIRIWNMNQLENTYPFLQPYYDINVGSPVMSLKYHKNQIFLGCDNGTVKLISLATGKITKSLKISSQTPITGLDVAEDKTSVKLIIWHENGIEVREFCLPKLSSKKTSMEKYNRKNKQKAPKWRVRETSETLSNGFAVDYWKGSEILPANKKKTYEGVKKSLKDRCCTLSGVRTQQPKSLQFTSDIFSEMFNAGPSKTDSFILCTFPRNLRVNSE